MRDDRPAGDNPAPAGRFAYSPDRKGEHLREHLKNFTGTLQADAYSGFHLYDTGRIRQAACWAHARRKFHDIHAAHPSPPLVGALDRVEARRSPRKRRLKAAWTAVAVIDRPPGTRIWIAAGVTDMRRGFDGLSTQMQTVLEKQPLSGHVFVFRGRRGDILKLLWFDALQAVPVRETAGAGPLYLAAGGERNGGTEPRSVIDAAGSNRLAEGGAHVAAGRCGVKCGGCSGGAQGVAEGRISVPEQRGLRHQPILTPFGCHRP